MRVSRLGLVPVSSPDPAVRRYRLAVKLNDAKQSSNAVEALLAATMEIEGEWLGDRLERYTPQTDYGIGEIPRPANRADLRNMAWQDGHLPGFPNGDGTKHFTLTDFARQADWNSFQAHSNTDKIPGPGVDVVDLCSQYGSIAGKSAYAREMRSGVWQVKVHDPTNRLAGHDGWVLLGSAWPTPYGGTSCARSRSAA